MKKLHRSIREVSYFFVLDIIFFNFDHNYHNQTCENSSTLMIVDCDIHLKATVKKQMLYDLNVGEH